MKLLLIILLGLVGNLIAQTPTSRWVDGKIEFAKWDVNGEIFYTDAEKDKKVSDLQPFVSTLTITVTAVTPSVDEINLSTFSLKFDNYSDFMNCLNSKQAIYIKKLQLQDQKAVSDAIGTTATSKDLTEQINYLNTKQSAQTQQK